SARYLQVGQGFFVKAIATDETLVFTDDIRTHVEVKVIDKSMEMGNGSIINSLIIKVSKNGKQDISYLNLRDTANWEYDSKMDVHKLFGLSSVPQIFSYIDIDNDEVAAINSIPFPYGDEVVPLGFKVNIAGDYLLEFNGGSSFNENQPLFLFDHVSGEAYDLRVDSTLSFTYSNTDPENRFDLCFDQMTPVGQDIQNDKDWDIFAVNNSLFIQSEEIDDAEIQIYNLQGQVVYSSRNIQAFSHGKAMFYPSAYYLVKITSDDKIQHEKIFLQHL
ncbi:MAG: T9SS type A sorting domain-containing protein, partial [Bacteroidales bacterium]|nr:T9SS type A sorting domain-containing protein [Bacteroidales bacterium]